MRRRRIIRLLTAFCLLGLFAGSAHAAKIILLISDTNKIYSLIKQGLRENLKGEVQEVVITDPTRDPVESVQRFRPDLIVAVGDAAVALARKKLNSFPMVGSGMVSDPITSTKTPGVALNFPLTSYFRLIRESLPKKRKIGILYDVSKNPDFAAQASAQADAYGLDVIAEPIDAEKEIARALQSLQDQKADVFLMTYDPLVMNPESFRYLVDFSINSKIALVVPSKTLLKNGGVLSLEADYIDLGRQTVAVAQRVLGDRTLLQTLRLEPPNKEEIGINLKMATVLDIRFPDPVELKAIYIIR